MAGRNLERLQKVASGLGDLNKSVVYVGGAVAELYVSDPAAADIRPTMDVDCVIELASYKGFNELCELLRKKRLPKRPNFRCSYLPMDISGRNCRHYAG